MPRPRHTVDQHDVTEDAAHVVRLHPWGGLVGGDGRVPERPVGGERPVADHQRQIPVTAGEGQRFFLLVTDQEEPGQAAVHVRTGEIHRVVVVPEGGCPLPQRIPVVPLANGGRSGESLGGPVGPDRQDQVGWIPVVLGRGAAAVQMRDGRHLQFVAHPHADLTARSGDDGRSGEKAVVAPDPGRQPGQNLDVSGPRGEPVVVGAGARPGDRRHRQWPGKGLRERRFAAQLGSGGGRRAQSAAGRATRWPRPVRRRRPSRRSRAG